MQFKTVCAYMFEEPIENHSNHIPDLVSRYEKMLRAQQTHFFDVYQFEDIADHYLENGKFSDAITAANMAKKQHPFSAIFPLKKAHILSVLNQLEEAASEIKIAEALEPSHPDLFIVKATLLSKNDDHDGAIEIYQNAIEKADDPSEIYPYLAYEYQSTQEYDKAIKYLKDALVADPEDDIALYNLAFCFEMTHEYHEAVRFLDEQINRNPYCELSWFHLGTFHQKLTEYDKAIKAFEYTILIDDGFVAAYHETANCLIKQKKYEAAAVAIEDSFVYDTPSGYSYMKLAKCYTQMSKHKKAVLLCKKALHEDPQLAEAWYEKGLNLDAIYQYPESIYAIKKAVELDPENQDYIYTLAKAQCKYGYLAEAENGFKELIDLGCKHTNVWIDYAKLLFDQDNIDDAIYLIQRGITHNTDDYKLLCILAGYFLIIENKSEGENMLKQALAANEKSRAYFFENFPYLTSDTTVANIIKSVE